jgi:poly(3-hydroxybutyrate) depolymerase
MAAPARGSDVTTAGGALYTAYQPNDYNPSGVGGKGYPVMLALHGCYSSYRTFGAFDFQSYVGSDGIVVYPSSTNPNETGSCSWDPFSDADIDRLAAIIKDVAAKYCIDESRVLALGYSWGAYMAHALACSKPGLIKAVAGTAGGFQTNLRNATQDVCGHVPTLVYGRVADAEEPVSRARYARDARILGINGCSASSTPAAFPFNTDRPNPPNGFSEVKGCVDYAGCAGGQRNTYCEDPTDLVTIGGQPSWNHTLWQPYRRPIWEWFTALP